MKNLNAILLMIVLLETFLLAIVFLASYQGVIQEGQGRSGMVEPIPPKLKFLGKPPNPALGSPFKGVRRWLPHWELSYAKTNGNEVVTFEWLEPVF